MSDGLIDVLIWAGIVFSLLLCLALSAARAQGHFLTESERDDRIVAALKEWGEQERRHTPAAEGRYNHTPTQD